MSALQAIAGKFPCRVIAGESPKGPLIVRYFLFRSRPLSIYLHRLCRSDEDRALHDHPWTFVSLILTSGYTEHTLQGARRYRPGSLLIRPAEWRHRLEMDAPAWTLVFRFRRRRAWGFWCPDGWKHWAHFEADGGCQ
jgi:hypothetical protein